MKIDVSSLKETKQVEGQEERERVVMARSDRGITARTGTTGTFSGSWEWASL